MSINTQKLIDELIDNISIINSEEIPSIDLYMDQVTTFMEKHLSSSKRYEDDKILTKTMINNYAKNHLLPPPDKKRYSKEHVIMLIFIYYFKNIMSINDIKTLLGPLADNYFKSSHDSSLEDIYDEIFSLEKDRQMNLSEELSKCLEQSCNVFSDRKESDRDFLQLFSLICILTYDTYIRKQLIEKIIDEISKMTNSDK